MVLCYLVRRQWYEYRPAPLARTGPSSNSGLGKFTISQPGLYKFMFELGETRAGAVDTPLSCDKLSYLFFANTENRIYFNIYFFVDF